MVINIVNNAGPEGEQAVTLRTVGNFIAHLRCSNEGFQDTLYVDHGSRHFFNNCDIFGSIDFVFGAASLVIQNLTLHVKRPLDGQQTVITTDERDNNKMNTAIVIHGCSIIPTSELKADSNVKTHLGRSWKKYAHTIIMQSYVDDFIDLKGWMKFDESLDVTTLYCSEFWNLGHGSNTNGRVKWPGYHNLNNPTDVKDFNVEKFINGNECLLKFYVPYSGGLA